LDIIGTIRHSSYAKTILPIVLVVCLALGFFFGLQLVLGNSTPVRVVESGSMCIPHGYACNGWQSLNHSFAQTLHKGDIIIIQGVDPKDLNTNYPNSDIIVYKKPTDPSATPIVHRIVTSYEVNGTLYFQTKGDGNGRPWPQTPLEGEYDSNAIWHTGEGVPADLVEGRVIMRIPYFGWVTLILNGNYWILPAIVALIVLLIAIEFIVPAIKQKAKPSADLEGKA
jgi:signal peptidase I